MERAWGAQLGASLAIGAGVLLTLAAMLGPLPPADGRPGASLTVRLPALVQMIVLALFALSGLLLLLLQRRPRQAGEGPVPLRAQRRPSAWTAFVALLPFLVLVALAWYVVATRVPGDVHPIDRALNAITGLADLLALVRKPPTTMPFVDVTIAVLVLIFALAIFALLLLLTFAERLEAWWGGRGAAADMPAVRDEPVVLLGDPRLEPDPRSAIILAWARFEGALATARAPRAPWQTPAELARVTLARLPLPPPAVERLAALFELARFSERPLESEARVAACDALDAITMALEADAARAR